MNDEIKLILKKLKIVSEEQEEGMYLCDKEHSKLLLDYITNLQQQLHQASLDIQELTERDIECPSWCDKLTNLQQENQELNDSITWWNNRFNAVQRDYEELKQENKEKDKIIKIMENYLELIIDLGYDYDGLSEDESLKGLINELVRYASLGRAYNTTETIYVNGDKKYNILHEKIF